MGKPEENDLPEPDESTFVEDDQTYADEPVTHIGDYVDVDTQDPDANGAT